MIDRSVRGRRRMTCPTKTRRTCSSSAPGPAGLFAAYYAGFRGLRVAVVDSLPELGGQITAMYPEKAILDVAGFRP